MISYTELSQEIKESREVRTVRKKSPFWDNRKLLSVYMDAFVKGVKTTKLEGFPKNEPAKVYQQVQIATYYVLRKELFKRMSPLVTARSRDTILLDNKKLLDKFDECVMSGVDKVPEDSRKYMMEICRRMGQVPVCA